jgi:hypothetical protein
MKSSAFITSMGVHSSLNNKSVNEIIAMAEETKIKVKHISYLFHHFKELFK